MFYFSPKFWKLKKRFCRSPALRRVFCRFRKPRENSNSIESRRQHLNVSFKENSHCLPGKNSKNFYPGSGFAFALQKHFNGTRGLSPLFIQVRKIPGRHIKILPWKIPGRQIKMSSRKISNWIESRRQHSNVAFLSSGTQSLSSLHSLLSSPRRRRSGWKIVLVR